MKRLLLIGFTACAFACMPSFSVSAMPMAPADQLITGTDNSARSRQGRWRWWWLGQSRCWPATRMEPGAKGWLAWSGLPSWSLEARALLKLAEAIAWSPLLRFNGGMPRDPFIREKFTRLRITARKPRRGILRVVPEGPLPHGD